MFRWSWNIRIWRKHDLAAVRYHCTYLLAFHLFLLLTFTQMRRIQNRMIQCQSVSVNDNPSTFPNISVIFNIICDVNVPSQLTAFPFLANYLPFPANPIFFLNRWHIHFKIQTTNIRGRGKNPFLVVYLQIKQAI